MNGGDFDGSAAFSGGGFMPSQANYGTDGSSSSYKKSDIRVMLPVTVKTLDEISTSGEPNFSIEGVDVATVVIVGRVCKKDDKITQTDFLVDDGTGLVECIRWVNERVDTDEVELILPGIYVRVHGNLKSIQGRRSINAFSIRPLTDFNEIVSHFIECMYVHMYNTKIRGRASTQSQMTNPPRFSPVKSGYQPPPANQYSGQYGDDSAASITQKVLTYLNQPMCLASEAGMHCDIIAQSLKIPLDKIRKACELLACDGYVYSTTDDNCYKSTTNG